MQNEVKIAFPGGEEKYVPFGCKVRDIVGEILSDGFPAIAAKVNNMIVPLSTPLICDSKIEPLSIATEAGAEVYRATLAFVAAKCAAALFPKCVFRVRASFGTALYCTVETPGGGEMPTGGIDALRNAIAEEIEKDSEIKIETMGYAEAVKIFRDAGREDEANLLRHRNPPVVLLTKCGEYYALNQAPLATHTGALNLFEVEKYEGGLLLNCPSCESPSAIVASTPPQAYFKVVREQIEWGRVVEVQTVGELNDTIMRGQFNELVRAVETRHTKSLSKIADRISSRTPAARLVLVAGPSSAGKTTASKRLCTQLMVNGVRTLMLSTDDYFKNEEDRPLDENGAPDYESVMAVDKDRLILDLKGLLAGESVHLRKFDFLTRKGFDSGKPSVLPERGVVVIEGLHALNPVLTEGIEDSCKFRIFLNTFTQLVLDSCNRISTTDTRLLRRLVRDSKFRNMPPLETLKLWKAVCEGERKWIYPFSRDVDALFNTALDYELAILKPAALRLLNQVKPWDEEFVQARRLSGILHNVSIASDAVVSGDSILREAIGNSQLSY